MKFASNQHFAANMGQIPKWLQTLKQTQNSQARKKFQSNVKSFQKTREDFASDLVKSKEVTKQSDKAKKKH